MRDGLGIHADTRVGHGQLDLTVNAAHGELDLAARGHCVAGVEHEVRDHLFDLAAVSAHAAAGRHGGRELHVVAQKPRDQSLELFDDLAEIEDLCQEHLVAAESEQLTRELRGTIGGPHDLQSVCAPRVVVVEAGHEELAVAADRGQQVVEVVRDTTGEPSDRFELLRVHQLLLQKVLIGDVPIVDDDHPLAVLGAPASDRLDRAPVAVAVAKPGQDRHRFLAREHRSERPLHGLAVVRVQQRKGLRAQELLGRVAEHALDGRTLVEACAVGGEHRDRVGRVLDQRAEQFLAGAQCFLRGELLGDVAEAPHTTDDVIAQPLRRRVALDRPAVEELEDITRHALGVFVDLSHPADELLRVGEAVDHAAERCRVVTGVEHGLRDRPQLDERAVVGRDLAFHVDDEDRVGGRVECGLEQGVRAFTGGFGLLQSRHVEPDASDESGLAVLVEHERGADAEPHQPAVGGANPVLVRVVGPLPNRPRGDCLDPHSIHLVDVREQGLFEALRWIAENALGLLADVRESIRAPVVLGHDRVDRADQFLEALVGRFARHVSSFREKASSRTRSACGFEK